MQLVLTILQALGSGQLTLRAEHFTQFSSLIALEIQGSPLHPTLLADDKPDIDGNIVIMSDTLRSMTSLQFLHLQHVRLLGQPEVAAKPTQLDNSKYLPSNGEPRDKDWKHKHSTMPHQLVFLSAADPLPYDEYKVAQEVAGLSLFRGLSNLLFLRVYQCGLKEIRWEMFDGLTKLLYLSLESNDLHYIPEFAFYGAPHLKTLSLAKNKLLNLQFTGFAGLLELEKLDLSYNNISHLSELSLPPMPKLKIADLRYNPIERIFASTFEIMNQTEIIYLGSNEAKLELKQSIWHGLSFLKRLSIFNAQAVQLENDMLVGMPKLKELQIEGKIDALAFDAFMSVPKLETLVLKNCGITQVSMDTFLGLHGLVALDLSYNALSTLPPGLFDQLQSLKELQLQNNRLVELPEDIFLQLNAKLIRLEGNPWHCSCAMKEWRPMQINKVKVIRNSLQPVSQHSKSLVQMHSTQYVFEKRVAPKCKTPLKYQNWNVFHVLRKELRCGKPKMLHMRKSIKPKAPEMTTPHAVNTTISEASTLLPNIISQHTTAAPEQETQAVEDNNPIDTIPTPNQTEEIDPNELQVLPSNMQERQLETHLKAPILPTNSFIIQHQGQQLKVSKKAYKLELERVRSEKLRKLQAMTP
ncbi:hypothetical protein B566_EDAN009228 [Ephemera danica]|nr:hypothetical protein B566_EDAN009228 [Ephemera danica]